MSVDSDTLVQSSILWKHFHDEQHHLAGFLVVRRPEVRVVVDDLTVVVPRDFRHRVAADLADEARLVPVHHLLGLQFPHEHRGRSFHLEHTPGPLRMVKRSRLATDTIRYDTI